MMMDTKKRGWSKRPPNARAAKRTTQTHLPIFSRAADGRVCVAVCCAMRGGVDELESRSMAMTPPASKPNQQLPAADRCLNARSRAADALRCAFCWHRTAGPSIKHGRPVVDEGDGACGRGERMSRRSSSSVVCSILAARFLAAVVAPTVCDCKAWPCLVEQSSCGADARAAAGHQWRIIMHKGGAERTLDSSMARWSGRTSSLLSAPFLRRPFGLPAHLRRA